MKSSWVFGPSFGTVRKSVEESGPSPVPVVLVGTTPKMMPIRLAPIHSHSAHQLSTDGSGSSGGEDDSYPDPSSQDTLVVLLTLSLISVTVYFSYRMWRKRRHRALSASKLEDYRYSRLSQNEIDVDNIEFNHPLQLQQTLGLDVDVDVDIDVDVDPDGDLQVGHHHHQEPALAPATLHVETETNTSAMNCTNSANSNSNSMNLDLRSFEGENHSLIDDLSDEQDLLQ